MERKINLKKINETIPAKENGEISQTGKTILFKTIQIKNQDPSNFSLKIKIQHNDGKSILKTINLVDYRTMFKTEHKELYILDISKIREFQDYNSDTSIDCTIESVEQFENIDIEIFYSLNPPTKPSTSIFLG